MALIDDLSKPPQAIATPAPKPAQTTPTTSAAVTPAAVTNAATQQAGLTQAALKTGAVDENQTVQGQLKGIIDSNGPLQQQAAARARSEAGARGLSNSSMAVEAGQSAVIGSALPIAQQDASTYGRQSLQNQADTNRNSEFNTGEANNTAKFNAGESNTTAKFNTGESNTTAKFNAGEANTVSKFNADQANAVGQSNTAQANTVAIQNQAQQNDLIKANLDVASKTNLTQLETANKQLLQANASAQGVQQQLMIALQNIQNNTALDATARQTAIDQQLKISQNSLSLIGAMDNLNLDSLLSNFGSDVATGGANAKPITTVAQQQAAANQAATANTTNNDTYRTCFPAGTMVRLPDGSLQAIERIKVGDWVMGMGAPVRVLEMHTPTLGPRRMLSFDDGSLLWSEEHAMWTKDASGSQWWYAANPDAWRAEVSAGMYSGLDDNSSIRSAAAAWAHIDGWAENTVVEKPEFGPETQLYLPVTHGSPIIVNGYVVGACLNQKNFDYAKLDWDVAREQILAVEQIAA